MIDSYRSSRTPPTPAGARRPERQVTTGVYYDTEWAHRPAARLVRAVGVWGFMKPAIALYGSPKVIGADRLSDVEGPVVFAALPFCPFFLIPPSV